MEILARFLQPGLLDIEPIQTVYTDAEGHFAFADLPVGEYEMRVRPPAGWWLVYGGNVGHSDVRRNEHGDMWLQVEPVA
jgi:hypothetical protein